MEIGALANAGDDIVERPLFARRVKRVIGCEQGNPDPLRQIVQSGEMAAVAAARSEEHTSELQSLMRISYAVFCLKKKKKKTTKSNMSIPINYNTSQDGHM